MLIYPPGRAFQRGEDRCQIDIDASLVNCSRACNDLGYVSSCLKRSGYNTFIKDYQVEKLTLNDLIEDIKSYQPDVLFISITNGSIYDDICIIEKIKKIKQDILVILKGALFFNPEKFLLDDLNLSNVDYLIGGEVEFIIENLINAHFKNKSDLTKIEGISYRRGNEWVIQKVTEFNDKLDYIPFPDRTFMNNKLYINPETNRTMALITVSKGCCYNCSYCLSPIISGKKVRFRSPDNIFMEIKECIEKYNIYDFFFKSDTFTFDRNRVIELCELLINSGINRKINWTASTRVDVLDEELIKIMKKAGCSLLALGFESGSQDSLNQMNKHTTVNQNIDIAKLCQKNGIKILGHFLIGFPWEDENHLKETQKHIFKINADYIEISVVVPYYKTPLNNELYNNKIIEAENILGYDSFNKLTNCASKIPIEKLIKFKKETAIKFYLRPSYIFKRIMKIKSYGVFKNYLYYGYRMIKNTIKK